MASRGEGIISYNMNDVVNKHRNKPKDIITVPKKEIFIILPYLGIQSKIVTQQLKSCIYKLYGCFNPKIIFRNNRRIKSFFPYKDRLNRSLRSKVVYKASCWDCNDFYIGKTKRRLHDRKTEHFKALTSNSHSSAIADHMTQTGHKIKWDHFDILATGRSDMHCKIKETLFNMFPSVYAKPYANKQKMNPPLFAGWFAPTARILVIIFQISALCPLLTLSRENWM